MLLQRAVVYLAVDSQEAPLWWVKGYLRFRKWQTKSVSARKLFAGGCDKASSAVYGLAARRLAGEYPSQTFESSLRVVFRLPSSTNTRR